MSSDAADSAPTSGSRACEVNVRIISFSAPELLISTFLIVVKEREIQVTMEDVSARQGDVLLQVER